MIRQLLTIVLVALFATPAIAQTTRPYDRAFSVTPAAADAVGAAGPFTLAFSLRDREPGDAATMYLTAFSLFRDPPAVAEAGPGGDSDADARGQTLESALNASLADLDLAETQAVVDRYRDALDLIEKAARRGQARFEFPINEQGMATLLPHLSDARTAANVLAVRTMLHASTDDIDAALADLRLIFTLARHVGGHDGAVLVENMVGVGVTAIGYDRLAKLQGADDVPNLYWALAALPEPIDFRRTVENERVLIYGTFPQLRDPDAVDADSFNIMMRAVDRYADGGEAPTAAERLRGIAERTAGMAFMLPSARGYLLREGHFTEAELDDLGPYRTIAHYMDLSYGDAFGELVKAASLPPRESIAAFGQIPEELAGDGGWGRLFVNLLSPSLASARQSFATVERQRVALVAVEALRDHAAKTGELPQSLAELAMFVPPDPYTGQPLGYQRDGDTAVLAAVDVGLAGRPTGFTWTITLRRDE